MSDEFQRKLESYENGQLSGEELAEFEAELEKLEQYQAYFEENKPQQPLEISEKKQKKILRRSKWKARFQTAMMALSIFIIVLITTSILTAIFYSWGNPDRSEVMANVDRSYDDGHGSIRIFRGNKFECQNIFQNGLYKRSE